MTRVLVCDARGEVNGRFYRGEGRHNCTSTRRCLVILAPGNLILELDGIGSSVPCALTSDVTNQCLPIRIEPLVHTTISRSKSTP